MSGPPPGVPGELRHLEAFVAAAREGSFSRAARRLHVSQQALSRTIAQLETRMTLRLFDRGARSLSLTREGEALLPAAERALAAAGEVFETAVRIASGATVAPLRVDISSGGIETGAAVLRRVRRACPDIAIEQREVGRARGLELLAAHELDVVLARALPAADGIRMEPLRHERLLVGMSAEHPLAARPEVPVAALAGVPLLLPSDEAAAEWNDFVEGLLHSHGLRPRRFAGVTHGSVAAAEVVRDGGCVVPTMAWTEPPPGLAFRPVVAPAVHMTWGMYWLSGSEQRAAVDALLRSARALAAEEGWLEPPEVAL